MYVCVRAYVCVCVCVCVWVGVCVGACMRACVCVCVLSFLLLLLLLLLLFVLRTQHVPFLYRDCLGLGLGNSAEFSWDHLYAGLAVVGLKCLRDRIKLPYSWSDFVIEIHCFRVSVSW